MTLLGEAVTFRFIFAVFGEAVFVTTMLLQVTTGSESATSTGSGSRCRPQTEVLAPCFPCRYARHADHGPAIERRTILLYQVQPGKQIF